MYLAIDPGRDTGWALFSTGGDLLDISVSRPKVRAARVIIERPQIYDGTPPKEANDLITLALGAGRYWEQYHASGSMVDFVLPHAWKGTIKKDIHHNRLISHMSAREALLVHGALSKIAAGKQHNALDAFGLGKWAFKKGPWRHAPH